MNKLVMISLILTGFLASTVWADAIRCRHRGQSYSIRLGTLPFCKEVRRAPAQAQPQTDASSVTFSSYMTANAQDPALNPRYEDQNAFQLPPTVYLNDDSTTTTVTKTAAAAAPANTNTPAASSSPTETSNRAPASVTPADPNASAMSPPTLPSGW